MAPTGKTLIKILISKTFRYFLSRDAIETARQIAANQSIETAILYLQQRYKFFKPSSVRFLLGIYHYLLTTNHPLKLSTTKNLIIHICCWGESYSDKLTKYLLPSLLAHGNLPSLQKTYKITLLIHCDRNTKIKLAQWKTIIGNHAELVLADIPTPMNNFLLFKLSKLLFSKKLQHTLEDTKYFLLGAIQTQAFQLALKNKAYISFLTPDMVLSDIFYTEAFSQIKNKKMVGASAFRTNFQMVQPKLESFYTNKQKNTLSISARVLSKLQVECIHHSAKRRVVSESTLCFNPSAQLLFKNNSGIVIRTFHYHPFLINCSEINHSIKLDYYPIDNLILDQILSRNIPYEQQVWICDDGSKMSFMELSDDHIEPLLAKHKYYSYQELIDAIKLMLASVPEAYDMPLNRYFGSIRLKLETGEDDTNQSNFIDDQQFFAALRQDTTENCALH